MHRAVRPSRFLRLLAALSPLATIATARAQCPDWRTFGPDAPDGRTTAAVVFDDGSGPALYAGGYFTRAGGVLASHIARWNGSAWSEVGGGTDAPVLALCVYDDGSGAALYAAGEFTHAGGVAANRIAKWNGSTWSPLGHGLRRGFSVPTPYVAGLSLTTFDDGTGPALYVGGVFLAAGDGYASGVARWNGTQWSSVGGRNGVGFAEVVYDDGTGPALYASGGGGYSIGKWNGTAWTPLGTGPDNTVTALAVHDDGTGPALYAGGYFDAAGGQPAYGIARWNGTAWSPLGSGTTGYEVRALTSFDDGSGRALYAGGDFWSAGGAPNSAHIARWDGSSWSALGSGLDAAVDAFATYDSGSGTRLYALGAFTSSGAVHVDHVATWNGSTWRPLGTIADFDGPVQALITWNDGSGDALYAAGNFTGAGEVAAERVAKWNGSTWSPLGLGVSAWAYCLATFDDGGGSALYVGGTFTSAGGSPASFVAKWNGSTWSPLGSGTSAPVESLAVHDDGSGPALYAGGQFSSAGGIPAQHVARWNGSSWSALGGGVLGSNGGSPFVATLTSFDDGSGPALYAGGDFLSAGGVPASQIARWKNGTWSALGSGLSGGFYWTVLTTCVHDDGRGPALYVGGDFTIAGGVTANHVARWDGSTWSPLGVGTDARVDVLASFDDGFGPELVAGGPFTLAGGASAHRIAAWRGSRWTNLGSGVAGADPSSSPLALQSFDDGSGRGLWVGGFYDVAAGADSRDFAEWRACDDGPHSFCAGDGSAEPCPCGNFGALGNGCANAVQAAGAHLAASGVARVSADTFVLVGTGMPSSSVLYFQGTAPANDGAGAPFEGGLRCAAGHVTRLAAKSNVAGTSAYPSTGEAAISVRGGVPPAGGSRTYQAWYRDVVGMCGSTSNLTNGVRVTWLP